MNKTYILSPALIQIRLCKKRSCCCALLLKRQQQEKMNHISGPLIVWWWWYNYRVKEKKGNLFSNYYALHQYPWKETILIVIEKNTVTDCDNRSLCYLWCETCNVCNVVSWHNTCSQWYRIPAGLRLMDAGYINTLVCRKNISAQCTAVIMVLRS